MRRPEERLAPVDKRAALGRKKCASRETSEITGTEPKGTAISPYDIVSRRGRSQRTTAACIILITEDSRISAPLECAVPVNSLVTQGQGCVYAAFNPQSRRP
ncbi:hypothetical protein MRX96_010144 [Rhipicephalus microplus]